jgi:hypothetical protein
MQINQTFFKLKLLNDLLKNTAHAKQLLLDECIDIGGTDPVILMRRFRMLSQLSQFESNIINKIDNFEISSLDDFNISQSTMLAEIGSVVNRSA